VGSSGLPACFLIRAAGTGFVTGRAQRDCFTAYQRTLLCGHIADRHTLRVCLANSGGDQCCTGFSDNYPSKTETAQSPGTPKARSDPVFPYTPGEEAGIRKGDIVIAVNGMPIQERGCVSPSEALEVASAILSISRDGSLLEIEVELSVLIP